MSEKIQDGASLLPGDPSAQANTEPLPDSVEAAKREVLRVMGSQGSRQAHVATMVVDALINAVRVEMLRHHHDCESDALTVCGVCGEPSTTEVCKGCA